MDIKQVFFAYNVERNSNTGNFQYCPMCGTHLSIKEKGGKPRPACHNCGYLHFQNPIPGVVVVIEKREQILLGKRAGGYGKGKWGLPQGYVEYEEDFLTAAIREVKEETGLDISLRSIINVVSNMLSPTLHTLAIVLLAGVKSGELCACDDLEVLEWFPISGAMPELAFEADEFIIRRVQHTKFEEGLPVDPKSGKMLYLSG